MPQLWTNPNQGVLEKTLEKAGTLLLRDLYFGF
jgi:hypothetical protein